jgi:hypothetical protein
VFAPRLAAVAASASACTSTQLQCTSGGTPGSSGSLTAATIIKTASAPRTRWLPPPMRHMRGEGSTCSKSEALEPPTKPAIAPIGVAVTWTRYDVPTMRVFLSMRSSRLFVAAPPSAAKAVGECVWRAEINIPLNIVCCWRLHPKVNCRPTIVRSVGPRHPMPGKPTEVTIAFTAVRKTRFSTMPLFPTAAPSKVALTSGRPPLKIVIVSGLLRSRPGTLLSSLQSTWREIWKLELKGRSCGGMVMTELSAGSAER